MKQVFATAAGTIEVVLYPEDRMISVTRLDEDGRPTAAAMESWDYVDLVDLFGRQMSVPVTEAEALARTVSAQLSAAPLPVRKQRDAAAVGVLENAGVALRFVAVLLDSVLVLLPLSIAVGLLTGGGYAERGDGYANAGVDLAGKGVWLFLLLGIAYYVLGEALTGATVGKRLVGIRVVDEDGEHPTLGAAVGRNVLRVVDGLFFYLVGAIFALTSPRGQRLGDRVAHTVVVRR